MAWCCERAKLAVITRQPREGTVPDELLIVDAESGNVVTVKGVSVPWQLHWAAFDSSLYVKTWPGPEANGSLNVKAVVYRRDVSGRLHRTTRRGIFFSPDGQFYFDSPTPTGGFQTYRSSDDREMQWALPKEVDARAPRGEWVPNSDHALVFTEREIFSPPMRPTDPPRVVQPGAWRENVQLWNVMLDAETGVVMDRFQGGLRSGWSSNAKALVLLRNTGPELVPFRRK
jgi:hypothetical protein